MAQVAFYLKLNGIDGESEIEKHKNEIDVESWSWGETNSGDSSARGGSGVGKVIPQDMHVVSKMCKASPKLMQHCAEGKPIPDATLTCTRAGGSEQVYLKLKMTDLIISSYQTGGSNGSQTMPVDQYSLNFAKIEYEYAAQDAKGGAAGTVKGQYDFKKGKA